MKKIIYTASLLSLFAVSAKAQSETKQQEPKATQQPQAKPASAPQKEEKAPAAQPSSSGTRMAINEKGVPASKGGTATKEKKEDKTASPGQPVTAPEKH